MRKAALAIALIGGCRSAPTRPVETFPEPDGGSLPRRTTAAAPPSAITPQTLDVAAKRRRFVRIDPGGTRPLPLVLVLHGDGNDAEGFHRAWPFETATAGEAILVYPEGERGTWDLTTTKRNPDVAFLEAIVDALGPRIDRARVFATGHSSGGFMANVLACQRPDLLHAIASNAGGAPFGQDERWPNGYPKCPGQKSVAMLALHGGRDGEVTLDSGQFSAEYWAYVAGCKTDAMEPTGYAECRLYRGCPAGKAVGLCIVPPLGHWVWEHSAEASWTFFTRQ